MEGDVRNPTREQLAGIADELGVASLKAEYLISGAAGNLFRLRSARESFVMKQSRVAREGLLLREAEALTHLASTGTVAVPAVHLASSDYLILEDLGEPAELSARDWEELGAQLGQLHGVHAERFGYERDNFIGIWEQRNPPSTDWVEFFYRNRVACFLDAGHNRALLGERERRGLEALCKAYRSRIPDQPPSLCHGDLWGNNVFKRRGGRVYLIDPAIHFGLPEADLAMTRMYSIFPEAFYSGYRQTHELADDWQDRLPFHQLKELVLMIAQFADPASLAKLRAMIEPHV